ncbi:hypothetical protein MAPG_03807 [Magnaporthiopsis poae ATCC 64411]|uniref:Xylanolytic transcriptional activator regulatory domain-containing protein n=1 Tax=Magnaporthiopsis poae (strain ATCC 64411 / 73-15) TaxID=644358 RepID=A0A0C4DV08_MAGP6|nr:hypothetical protein MAPG_03807 [Magnaporthiopsis poae ATCC 64411]
MAMAVFMRLSADSQAAAMLLSIAVRMQHAIGLGIGANGRGRFYTAEEEEGEKDGQRLLWATVILDADMSAGSGLPPARADLDNITLNPPRFTGSHYKDVIFALRAELARIQARVGAHLVDPNEAALAALGLELDSWALQTPFNGMLDSKDLPGPAGCSGDADNVPTLMLKLAYFNCRSMICWAFARLVATEAAQAGEPIDTPDDRAAGHRRTARQVSRATLRSLPQFPRRSFTSLWTALRYPVSASVALLAILTGDPANPEAKDDLPLLASFVSFLQSMVVHEGGAGCDLQKMLDGISKMEKVARDAVAAASLAPTMPVDPSLWPLAVASGRTGKAIGQLLACKAYHPMYVAQSFMGNTVTLDNDAARQLAEIVGIPWGESGYGPFVPDSLMPATYGFRFEAGSPA